MIIPNSNVRTDFSRLAFYKAPTLKFEVAGESMLTRKIECVKANSFLGLYKRFKSRNSKRNYTSLTLTQETSSKNKAVKVLVKNKDLKKLIGRVEFKKLQTLGSSSERFLHLKKCIGPLNPLDGRCKIPKGSPPSKWSALSFEINQKLKTLFPKLASGDIKKVRSAINAMLINKDSSIFELLDVKVEGKLEQIFLKKHKGQLLIEKATVCGLGGNATVYKVAGYALKKFNMADTIARAEERSDGKDAFELKTLATELTQEVEKEIEACNDLSTVEGILKIKAQLKHPSSDRLIGYVMKAYDGDFGDYLLSSLSSKGRAHKLCKHFKTIASIFAQMHNIDKVHADIKIDNIFTDFDNDKIKEIVVGDITKTDPENIGLSYSLPYCFKSEINLVKFASKNLPIQERLELQKKLDVRQFAFFLYYSVRAEKAENADLEGKVKLNYAFPPSDTSYRVSSPQDYSTIEERKANYIPIPKDEASRALRDFIAHLLTEDFEKLPSMEKVYEEFQEIYSIQSNKLLR